jgi:aromatic-L-amino-acid decarboxylase
LAELIARNCLYARRFAEGLKLAGCPDLNEVALNQVLVSFGSAERPSLVIARVREEGTCWCGGTDWQGHAAMHISVSSWAIIAQDAGSGCFSRRRTSRRLDRPTAKSLELFPDKEYNVIVEEIPFAL